MTFQQELKGLLDQYCFINETELSNEYLANRLYEHIDNILKDHQVILDWSNKDETFKKWLIKEGILKNVR